MKCAAPCAVPGRGWLAVLICLLLTTTWSPVGWGGSLWAEDQQRLSVGIKLFPAVLGAQEALAAQRGSRGALEVIVVYRGSDQTARQAAAALEEIGSVQDIPLRISTQPVAALDAKPGRLLAAIFIASVELEPKRLQRLSEQHRTLVFSPFAGHVAGGAVAGIHVADRILPAVNLQQARRAGVRFKPFFLKVAHHVE